MSQPSEPHPPLQLGTKVPGFGTVFGLRYADCERYYFLIDHHGSVSLMPSDVIEPLTHGGSEAPESTEKSPNKEGTNL